jgi:hypothetical protein
VDGVVLTGFSHALAAGDIGDITSQFVLANQDPRFAGMNLDDDYLTTVPGTRLSLFYYPPNTDLKVVELDEATKETATTGELQSVGTAFTPEASLAIRVPVFVVNGQFDQLVCGAGFSVCASAASLAAAEAPFFAPQACLQTFVNPATGHDLNLEPTAPSTYAAIRAWSDAFVGLNHAAPACSQP